MRRALLAGGIVIAAAIAAVTAMAQAQSAARTVAVYKTPTCGCCALWVKHLEQHGFATKVTDLPSLEKVKADNRVPSQAQSCHTAVVDGYVIEGHVPAAEIQRLLTERPKGVAGLAVAGMPIGSPGMEVAGQPAQPYNVLAFDRNGTTTVFARR